MDLGSDAGSSRSSSESNSSKVTPCSDCKSSPSPSSLDLAALDDDSEEEEEEEDDDDDEDDEAAYLPPRCPGPADALRAAPALRRSPQRSAAPRPRPHHRPLPPKQQQQQRRSGGGAPGPGGRRARRGGGGGAAQPPREPQPPAMDWAALERHLAGLQCREKERGQRANPASVSGGRGERGGGGATSRSVPGVARRVWGDAGRRFPLAEPGAGGDRAEPQSPTNALARGDAANCFHGRVIRRRSRAELAHGWSRRSGRALLGTFPSGVNGRERPEGSAGAPRCASPTARSFPACFGFC